MRLFYKSSNIKPTDINTHIQKGWAGVVRSDVKTYCIQSIVFEHMIVWSEIFQLFLHIIRVLRIQCECVRSIDNLVFFVYFVTVFKVSGWEFFFSSAKNHYHYHSQAIICPYACSRGLHLHPFKWTYFDAHLTFDGCALWLNYLQCALKTSNSFPVQPSYAIFKQPNIGYNTILFVIYHSKKKEKNRDYVIILSHLKSSHQKTKCVVHLVIMKVLIKSYTSL